MKMDIKINKYLLIWNLLYQSSVSEEMHELKQKLWKNYKKEYSLLHKEKDLIVKDLDDYIPDDDFIFNMVESSDVFKKIKMETNKYRINLMEIWDKNRKAYLRELNKILKYDFLGNYTIAVLHPNLEVVETDFNTNTIIIGKKIISRDKDNFLTYLIYKIIKNEFNKIKSEERELINAITELLITNELFTRVTNESKYNLGKKELKPLKEKIYPYFLMYLGIETKDMEKYMVRDNIFFNPSDYTYERHLKNVDIFSFINFIIKNKKVILRKKLVAVEEIELL